MRALSASCVSALLACAFHPNALPQDLPANETKPTIEVSLELRQGDRWLGVDSQAVFHSGDEIRFRFQTSLGGYLYVLNRTSNGDNTWLFPRPGQGQGSRVEPGPSYLVPGTEGSFIVGGRPGFDVTYWILSPTPIDTHEARLPEAGSQPSTLEPRCRGDVLRARGLCVDDRAGARPLTQQDQAPLELPRNTTLVSRDLKFRTESGSTRISAPKSQWGVIVYEFRIAHN
jgi:hypothetical protein